MILQALNRYYDILLEDEQSKTAPYGYSMIGVSFALNLTQEGELLDVLPLFQKAQRGKKEVEVPRSMMLPQRVKRASNIAPNFLWDNNVYVLGISDRDEAKPEYSRDRFRAFKELHSDLLGACSDKAGRALMAFLDRHDPAQARDHPAIANHLDGLLEGGNLAFQLQGKFIHTDPELREIWEKHYTNREAENMQCLVTGEDAPIARLHPSINKVRGARAGGASLVSFNKDSFTSYNMTQGQNSPVSRKAAFGYTTALNYLLSDANPNRKFFMGDTTVVYWAESENRAYEAALAGLLDPSYQRQTTGDAQQFRRDAEQKLEMVAEKVERARMLDLDAIQESLGDENPRVYILGLAPNAARVSVRFFITDPFEKISGYIMQHYHDLEIVKEFEDQPHYLSVRNILYETISKKSRDRNAYPLLAGAVLRAILTNSAYPAALYYAVLNRVRADMDDRSRGIRKINYGRAAIIKAFLLRKYRHRDDNPYKEVLRMTLNEKSTIPAYLLGRLFAVLEKVQQEAIGDVNASIKDRYFTSACASPRSVFPTLLRLSQHHIAKAKYGYASDHRIQEILDLIDVEQNPIPARLTLDEQGLFVLGYYHQRAHFYVKKGEAVEENES